MAEHLTITPAGFTILHEDGEPDPVTGKSKRRAYTVARLPEADFSDTPDEEFLRFARENGVSLPSVTTVLRLVDKSEGLKYWAERIGVEGAIMLARDGGLPLDSKAALGRMFQRGLRHFQVSEQKAQRGRLSHEELVAFGRGEMPRPLSEIPVEERGFARGLAAFLADYRPQIQDSEFMVASLEHGFAGRPDLRAELGISVQPNGRPAPPGLGLIDYKSVDRLPRNKPTKACPDGPVKTPYPENLMQTALYEVGAREAGYGASEWQAVVRVDGEGNYDFTVSWLDPERALALLPAYALWRECSPRVKTEGHTLPVGLGVAA